MRIFLRGCFDSQTGYGNTLTNLAMQLNKLGVDVYPICDGIGFEMSDEFTKLFQKRNPIGLNFDYYIVMDTPKNLKVTDNFIFCNIKIAYTMWEQTRLTKEFKKKNFKDFDIIVVPCEMNIEPFKEVFDKTIIVQPLGVDNMQFYPIERDFTKEELNVCACGAMTFRKGVDILIDVMLDERIKALPINFNIKNSQYTLHPDISKANPRVRIYEGIWPKERMQDFYFANDIMLALSRGEGFNQPAVEFLCTGGIVLTHSWGGHSTWANSEYCSLIPYKLVKVTQWDNVRDGSLWAEVLKEDIINRLIEMLDDRVKLRQLSFNAIKMAPFLGFDIMAKNFYSLLERINYEYN